MLPSITQVHDNLYNLLMVNTSFNDEDLSWPKSLLNLEIEAIERDYFDEDISIFWDEDFREVRDGEW